MMNQFCCRSLRLFQSTANRSSQCFVNWTFNIGGCRLQPTQFLIDSASLSSILKQQFSSSSSSSITTKLLLSPPKPMITNGFRCFSSRLLSSTKFSSSMKQQTANIARRWIHRHNYNQEGKRSTLMVMAGLVVLVLGSSYAAVPLYRIYCQKTGKGGKPFLESDINEKVANLQKVPDRKLKIIFEADKSSRLAWDFKPSQRSIVCSPGETVLAFYTAKNHLDRPVNGIATYTILPYEAGKYFNKIQCFCFEEQQLNADEEVDLPVFFYIDPEYTRDPFLFENQEIILSYNFFETKEGYKLPRPDSYRAHFPTLDSKTTSSAVAVAATTTVSQNLVVNPS